jgi:hypothetical protein
VLAFDPGKGIEELILPWDHLLPMPRFMTMTCLLLYASMIGIPAIGL